MLGDAKDAAVGVEERRVDCEAHEPHVNAGGGAQEDPLTPLEPGPPEKTPSTGERCLREETPLTHKAAVLPFQGYEQGLLVPHVDVVVVVGQREGRSAQAEE